MLAFTETLYAAMAEVDDLEGGGIVLDTGQVCHLPLIPLEGDNHHFPGVLSATRPGHAHFGLVCATAKLFFVLHAELNLMLSSASSPC